MDKVDNRMNVKIPGADLNPGSQQSNKVAGTAGSGSKPEQAVAASSGDTVTFTSTAAEMLRLEESLSKMPDVDNARVASIRASIDEGTYQINPEKIVDSLLKIDMEMR